MDKRPNARELVDSGRLTVSVEEAAAILGIARGTAYELARRNELIGAHRLGARRIVVSLAQLCEALGVPFAPLGESKGLGT